MQRSSFLLAMLGARCVAQTLTPETTSTTNGPSLGSDTGSKSRTIHTIHVSQSRNMIQPREVVAEPGDYIEWQFWSGTHQILRGDLNHPCSRYENFHPDGQGFSSGEKVVETPGQEPLIFQLQVNDSEPILFYSGTDDDCSRHMMMGVINPTNETNLLQWYDNTWSLTFQVREQESGEDEAPATLSSRSCGEGDFILGAGQVVGIALGGAAAIFVAGLLGFLCHRHTAEGHTRRRSYPYRYQPKYAIPESRPPRSHHDRLPQASVLETEPRKRWSISERRQKKPAAPRHPYETRRLPPIPSQAPAGNSPAARNMRRPAAKQPMQEQITIENPRGDVRDRSDEIPVVFAPPGPVELPTESRDWLSTYFSPASVSMGFTLSPSSNHQLSWSGNQALQRPSPV